MEINRDVGGQGKRTKMKEKEERNESYIHSKTLKLQNKCVIFHFPGFILGFLMMLQDFFCILYPHIHLLSQKWHWHCKSRAYACHLSSYNELWTFYLDRQIEFLAGVD